MQYTLIAGIKSNNMEFYTISKKHLISKEFDIILQHPYISIKAYKQN